MKYQYTSSGFKQGYHRPFISIPSGVKFLLITNIVVFILLGLSGEKNFLLRSFGLVPNLVWQKFKIWQLFTYLFIHADLLHILLNMFMLWVCGKDLENQWGKKDFFLFYFICGIGAGFITVLFDIHSFTPIVGASGAIYGLLVAYGFTYPNRILLLYGLFPIKAKYVVIGFGFVAFFASLSANQSNISHITHLSGMIIGFIFICFNLNWNGIKVWYFRLRLKNITKKFFDTNNETARMKHRVDEILDKLNDSGWESLTDQEEKYLIQASKKLIDDRSPN